MFYLVLSAAFIMSSSMKDIATWRKRSRSLKYLSDSAKVNITKLCREHNTVDVLSRKLQVAQQAHTEASAIVQQDTNSKARLELSIKMLTRRILLCRPGFPGSVCHGTTRNQVGASVASVGAQAEEIATLNDTAIAMAVLESFQAAKDSIRDSWLQADRRILFSPNKTAFESQTKNVAMQSVESCLRKSLMRCPQDLPDVYLAKQVVLSVIQVMDTVDIISYTPPRLKYILEKVRTSRPKPSVAPLEMPDASTDD